ncbi:MAG: glycosyltransferase family 4 protein [Deferrisomatales bacterium]
MEILLVSTHEAGGGAALAARRLLSGLRAGGVEARMVVQSGGDPPGGVVGPKTPVQIARALLAPHLDYLPQRLYRRRALGNFSVGWVPGGLAQRLPGKRSPLLHLHWVADGFVGVEAVGAARSPVLWTLHDMWPFTGGCHYAGDCRGYEASCGRCPVLRSSRERDLSRWVWRRKRRSWMDANLTLVAPSRWLAGCAARSTLFRHRRIEVIPNGLDLERFRPHPKAFARSVLCLPQDRPIVLFGAANATSDPRKGFRHLAAALETLARAGWAERAHAAVFGASAPVGSDPIGLALPAFYLGRLADETSLALAYSAADLFVAPSVEDNLPNTVLEALACGTPVVAFHVGGMPDLVTHRADGYLARPFEAEDLARGIAWVLEDEARRSRLSRSARAKAVREFGQELQARRYLRLYEEILPGRFDAEGGP